ncbi:hypothetical protein BD408DRAFT_439778 [Parasitella parasitica]|nr:hypothetical protein BD408DRAFT_439778 [Parasitella parasitica]
MTIATIAKLFNLFRSTVNHTIDRYMERGTVKDKSRVGRAQSLVKLTEEHTRYIIHLLDDDSELTLVIIRDELCKNFPNLADKKSRKDFVENLQQLGISSKTNCIFADEAGFNANLIRRKNGQRNDKMPSSIEDVSVKQGPGRTTAGIFIGFVKQIIANIDRDNTPPWYFIMGNTRIHTASKTFFFFRVDFHQKVLIFIFLNAKSSTSNSLADVLPLNENASSTDNSDFKLDFTVSLEHDLLFFENVDVSGRFHDFRLQIRRRLNQNEYLTLEEKFNIFWPFHPFFLETRPSTYGFTQTIHIQSMRKFADKYSTKKCLIDNVSNNIVSDFGRFLRLVASCKVAALIEEDAAFNSTNRILLAAIKLVANKRERALNMYSVKRCQIVKRSPDLDTFFPPIRKQKTKDIQAIADNETDEESE